MKNLVTRTLSASGHLLAMAMLLVGVPIHADAADWPTRPVTLIVPSSAGGGIDTLARTLQQGLSEELGQPMLVEDRPGAGGMIGASFVAKSKPDGYTMLVGGSATQAIAVSLYSKPTYDSMRDFAPITNATMTNFIVVVAADSPFKTMKELIAYAKQNPGKVFFGSGGVGTAPQLAGEMLKREAGIDMVHVPFSGLGPATTALLGGSITMIVGDEPTYLPQIKGGRVRALAAVNTQHSILLPELPTMAELGLPNVAVTSWMGYLAPAGTPRPIIDRMHDAVLNVMATPSVHQTLLAAGSIPVGNTPEEFSAFIAQEIVKWAKVIKESGARVD